MDRHARERDGGSEASQSVTSGPAALGRFQVGPSGVAAHGGVHPHRTRHGGARTWWPTARSRGGLPTSWSANHADRVLGRVSMQPSGNRFEALEPIRQGIRERGGIGEGVARGLRSGTTTGRTLDFQQEVAFFGIESELRAGARRQRRCGALRPHAKGESVVGTELRDDRGTPPGLARVQTDAAVDAREIRRSPAQVRRDLVGLDAAA